MNARLAVKHKCLRFKSKTEWLLGWQRLFTVKLKTIYKIQ